MLLPAICVMTVLFAGQLETTFSVEYNDKKYDFRITEQDLKAAPPWPANQANPPLAVRRAVEIAASQVATLLPDGKNWRLDRVSLKPIENYWIYVVEFLEPVNAQSSGQQISNGFQVIVLMNGVAVTPRVSSVK